MSFQLPEKGLRENYRAVRGTVAAGPFTPLAARACTWLFPHLHFQGHPQPCRAHEMQAYREATLLRGARSPDPRMGGQTNTFPSDTARGMCCAVIR